MKGFANYVFNIIHSTYSLVKLIQSDISEGVKQS